VRGEQTGNSCRQEDITSAKKKKQQKLESSNIRKKYQAQPPIKESKKVLKIGLKKGIIRNLLGKGLGERKEGR